MKNHEGYYDPTAGIAIIRASRKRRRKRRNSERTSLTYELREIPSFRRVLLILK